MPENVLRVLMLEDSPFDADLERRELQKGWPGLVVQRVDNGDDFVTALRVFSPDIILLDASLPQFDGVRALDLALRSRPDLPVIFVTGTMGEEDVADLLKRGAADIVLKDHIGRLLPSVKRAMNAVEERRERHRLEREASSIYRRNEAILASAGEGILGLDAAGKITFVNAAAARILGVGVEEMVGADAHATLHRSLADGRPYPPDACPVLDTVRTGTVHRAVEERFGRKGGETFPVELTSTPILEDGQVVGAVITFNDITERHTRETELAQAHERLTKLLNGTIQTIARMSETRDPYTAGHQHRVGRLAAAIGKKLGWPEDRQQGLYYCGLLHDIGKIAVPAEILSRPGRPSKAEMEMIRIHPAKGHDILTGLDFPWPVADVALQHHERLDGSGYPNGLRGTEIIEEARVMAVADVVEAMSSHRPYRPGLGVDAALEEIRLQRGLTLDPAAVDACIDLLNGDARDLLSSSP